MSNKPGRNDPCPCGSGKKYKRCCLPTDEAAVRERARQQARFDDDVSGDAQFDADDDGEELLYTEDAPILDMRAITRVCYTRGFVCKLSDLRSGRGVQITEWEAPQIPQEVLDSIEREGVDALEGEWGDPKAGEPIQVDVIDLETDADVVSIEVFNRAILLVHADSEEMRRIHRVCGVLEAAASGGPDQSAKQRGDATSVAVIRRADVSRPAATKFDLSSVLKEHRRQPGTCDLCGASVTRTNAHGHMRSCALAHDASSGPEQRLLHLRATASGLPAYWLDVEARADGKLEALDSFLRRVWLECCGHLSVFRIGKVNYFSRGYEFGAWTPHGDLGRQRPLERSMSARIGDALPPAGERFGYEYDFGSTTHLEIKVIGERTGRLGRSPVRLAVRNVPPVWPCAVCGEPATLVCAYCRDDDGNPFVCAGHRNDHACGEDEGFLPVVNSPRIGVCGYTGES